MADKNRGDALAAGIAGAAVGVVLGATAVAMADPKMRKGAIKKAGELKRKTEKTLTHLKAQTLSAGEELKKNLSEDPMDEMSENN